ncbi:hypothetical protein V5E97_21415 [Singulisphaera sp. Ch08]|uniref:Uncharacterized protein n=1 Tax=Singulisphaera sp. Ch08 TaxID=3120278 RepID=A0AAU7C6T5_9BACT
MTKKRHDDRPERRRNRYKRLAVLGFLTLGSNFGCGRDMLRLPAGSDGTLLGPAPIPYTAAANATATAAASRKANAIAPVALKPAEGYGSNIDDLFLTSYRDSNSYGPHLAKSTRPRPANGESPLSDGLLAANPASRHAPLDPSQTQGQTAERPALFSPTQSQSRQAYRDPADSPFQTTQIPPPRVRSATPGHLTQAAASPHTAPVQGPTGLVDAYGVTKIAPPRRPDPASLPDLETASKQTGISMPASVATSPLEAPAASQLEAASPPSTLAEAPSSPAVPVEVMAQSPTQSATTTEPTTSAESPAQAPALVEMPSEPATPIELPAEKPPALAEQPSEPATPVELPAEKPQALAEMPSEPATPVELPAEKPQALAEMPSEPATPVELPAEKPQALAEMPSESATPVELPAEKPSALAELPNEPATPVELPAEKPPALAEMPSQSSTSVDLLADPLALPEMPSQPTKPTEVPATAEIPSEPATLAELPNQPPALPENSSQTPPTTGMPEPLPPLAEIADELAEASKKPKGENPASPFEETSIAPPTPSKPGPQSQSGDLNLASEETKIPLPGQAVSRSPGQAVGTVQDEIPLPPLQMDSSVFGTSVELPPPLPLATPSSEVKTNAECPACKILKKQKQSDHWATGPVKQTILCPSCEENQARSNAKAKSDQKNHDLDSAVKDTKIPPPLRSAKVDPRTAH